MNKVDLYTRDGLFVEQVLLPESLVGERPEGIARGSRIFFRDVNGSYREGQLYQAVTEREARAAR